MDAPQNHQNVTVKRSSHYNESADRCLHYITTHRLMFIQLGTLYVELSTLTISCSPNQSTQQTMRVVVVFGVYDDAIVDHTVQVFDESNVAAIDLARDEIHSQGFKFCMKLTTVR
jgi:hypothetical protein